MAKRDATDCEAIKLDLAVDLSSPPLFLFEQCQLVRLTTGKRRRGSISDYKIPWLASIESLDIPPAARLLFKDQTEQPCW